MKRIFLILLILNYLQGLGQIYINEFCASNASIIQDAQFNDNADWVELYNISNVSINLNGYYISDNISNPDKWKINQNVYIPAQGYTLIWCDGESTGIHTNFKLSADSEEIVISTPYLEILDSITYGKQEPDVSFGRLPSSPTDWGFFSPPTPLALNSGKSYKGIVFSVPKFSTRGGMYSAPVNTTLKTQFGGNIRYTTDGSEPDINSTLYTSPINISQTKVLRARIFKTDSVAGPIITQSYFINENSINGKLPVVSIATDPDNFWSSENGIYAQEFKPEWEVPINIELFENNGADRAAFNLPAGTKINGLHSWKLPQKMLGIYFRKQYGESKLEYPLFIQRPRNSFKNFALRAGGSDWSFTLMRDMLAHHATLLNMDIEIMSYKPSVVFVNGEFLGIHNMREKVNDDYIEKSYGLEGASIDMVENEDYAEAGDLNAYNNFLTYLDKDLSIQSNFDQVANLMDIENFTDYVITEICTGNTSISHNVMAWKPKESGKWRWVLMDLDRGYVSTSKMIDYYVNQNVWPLGDLFDNDAYVNYFGKRIAAHCFTSFNPVQIIKLVDEHSTMIEDEMPRQVARWLGTTSSYGNAIPSVAYWFRQVHKIKNYAQERPAAILSDLSNYGFDGLAPLSLSSYPPKSGTFNIENLQVSESNASGYYLLNQNVSVIAKAKPGYDFKGWAIADKQALINRNDNWKYYDQGQLPASNWFNNNYDDSEWNTGQGQFGYGDDDENTVITYFNDGEVYITTYFRKKVTISQEQLNNASFLLEILKDDGAVIYINGNEVMRLNMGNDDISYSATAAYGISGTREDFYHTYFIDDSNFVTGDNTIAVEVHQGPTSKSDISFDLSLNALMPDNENIVATTEEYEFTFSEETHLTAQYERNNFCLVPTVVKGDVNLKKECSPYYAEGDIIIEENSLLNIEPGVEVYMPNDASIYVYGKMQAVGSENEEIIFSSAPETAEEPWGAIVIKNSSDTSVLNYVTIEGASYGKNKAIENAAIVAFKANLKLNHMYMVNNYGNPIVARYSDVTLTNSELHSDVTGDLINVKYGKAFVANCTFKGSNQPDTDAIDYDEIENGVIQNCSITDFWGFNSDAVDIGERATNILIDSLRVNKITDKGVSVGQQSTVTIQNSVFVNCNMGVAVKDSSHARIDRSIFYSNVNGVACFEKVAGRAGGNAIITNSIISNSAENAAYSDSKSSLLVNRTLSDTDTLNAENNNLYNNPLFSQPSLFDFNLQANSPAKGAGLLNAQVIDLGVKHAPFSWDADVMVSQVFINPNNLNYPEFIAIYNPNNSNMDISGYKISKGVTAELPAGTIIGANDVIYLTDNEQSLRWNIQSRPVIQWTEGKLSNNGEGIQLEDKHGIVIDYFKYEDNGLWPQEIFTHEKTMNLISSELDNHFAESWNSINIDETLDTSEINSQYGVVIYPNPTTGIFTIVTEAQISDVCSVFNLSGQLVYSIKTDANGLTQMNLTNLPSGLYFIKANNETHKVVKN